MAEQYDFLAQYFRWLREQLKQGRIRDEGTLSRTVELPTFPLEGAKTLLESLGYTEELVKPQYKMPAGRGYIIVDFLLGSGSSRWMLDLKAPGEDCDHQGHVTQLYTYLKAESVPIGVLFNGQQARAFVHSECKGLGSAKELGNIAVESANAGDDNSRKLADFFENFRAVPDLNTTRVAQKFVRRYRAIIRDERRKQLLKDETYRALSSKSRSLAEQVINESAELRKLGATPDDIINFWPVIQPVPAPHKKLPPAETPPNRKVKELVAQISQATPDGYERLLAAKIRGLRPRCDREPGGGYHSVPQRPGVPPGLVVGGVDTPTALRIIAELERLLD